MLDAAVQDVLRIAGVEVRALLSDSFRQSDVVQSALWPDGIIVPVHPGHEEDEFRRAAEWCDFPLVIAPEFDRILEMRCQWATDCGATLLGPPPHVVALCADKLTLAEQWESAGVPTIPTREFDPLAFPPPVVVKPRFGAGSQETYLLETQEEVDNFRPGPLMIVQPFLIGMPMSVSFLIGPAATVELTPCAQHMTSDDGRLRYGGGETMNRSALAERAGRCARRAIESVPGLFGYVGVDMIRRPDETDLAVEINPRLTTSYIGLRQVCQQNIMHALLRIVRGERVKLTWRDDNVSWRV
jgi:predicted ATP-grasp superfamily ATP-dependent carboligase